MECLFIFKKVRIYFKMLVVLGFLSVLIGCVMNLSVEIKILNDVKN